MQSVTCVSPARRAGGGTVRLVPGLLGTIVLFFCSTEVFADFVGAGFSDSFGLSANLDLTLLSGAHVLATLSPQPAASGNAPSTYNLDSPLASLNVALGSFALGTGTVLNAQSGLLDSSAVSDIDGFPGSHSAAATSVVHNLNLGVVETAALVNGIVHVSATTITSTTNATGLPLGTLGSTIVESLSIDVLGVNVFASTGPIAPNTGVNVSGILGGVTILLNGQTPSGNGVTGLGLATNAIDLSFTNVGVAGVGTLNGEVVIAHSAATVDSVPEPSTLALAGIAATLGVIVHRSRKRPGKPTPV